VVGDWLKEGKIKRRDFFTKVEREGIKEVKKVFGRSPLSIHP